MEISVYITSYNKRQYISQAIESVLNQTMPAKEIIIIDDYSRDNSQEIIREYTNRYPDIIKPIFNEQNKGISKARNIALSNCKYELITYLDGDDIFYKNKLENESNYLINNPVQVVYSNFDYINLDDKVIGRFANDSDSPAVGDIFTNTFLRDYNVSSGNNYNYEMFYKSCLSISGFYDEKIIIWEDWDFRIRMSKKFQYGYCPDVNSAYRKLENGLHNSVPGLHYREQMKIYKKNKHLLSDLEENEKRVIQNRIYSKLKKLIINIGRLNISKKQYLRLIINCVQFIWAFQSKKTVGFFYKELFNYDA